MGMSLLVTFVLPVVIIWAFGGWIAGLAAAVVAVVGAFAMLNAGWLD